MLYFQTLPMKPFTVSGMTFKGHSKSSAMSYFITLPGLSIRDRTSRQHLFSDKNAEMTLNSKTNSEILINN